MNVDVDSIKYAILSFNYKIWNCYYHSTVAYFVATGDAATPGLRVHTDYDFH